ncbi:hypothetical protein F7725_013941 [Dissostichus mawsoni]|uniref:Uncharacterized protein n=1 Tax=Dissostichus mawsoni TaxID=36200 RepID=A0A7J5YVP2_DISMA|nr:hypothetical protein F7725_013941 [Dissostichus mawsoni]
MLHGLLVGLLCMTSAASLKVTPSRLMWFREIIRPPGGKGHSEPGGRCPESRTALQVRSSESRPGNADWGCWSRYCTTNNALLLDAALNPGCDVITQLVQRPFLRRGQTAVVLRRLRTRHGLQLAALSGRNQCVPPCVFIWRHAVSTLGLQGQSSQVKSRFLMAGQPVLQKVSPELQVTLVAGLFVPDREDRMSLKDFQGNIW